MGTGKEALGRELHHLIMCVGVRARVSMLGIISREKMKTKIAGRNVSLESN